MRDERAAALLPVEDVLPVQVRQRLTDHGTGDAVALAQHVLAVEPVPRG